VEGMVANYSRIHKGTNFGQYRTVHFDEQSYQLELIGGNS
jgi:hypothetical protein